jgi:glycosyltransferase involved in cell wall biosynthesis
VLHINQVNLQPAAGGGEFYTRSLARALADAGAQVTQYVSAANRFWDGLSGKRLACVPVRDEADFLARLPRERSVILTQGPLSGHALHALADAHRLTGFAHMPMYQRSAEEFRAFRLVFSVSRYCIDLLRRAGLERIYPEPVYGIADLARGDAPILRRLPYDWDGRKFRDRLLGALEGVTAGLRTAEPFTRQTGLTLGIVSLLSPIKQLPQLFAILAPAIARHASVRLEIFGVGGYAQVRDLRRALAPLGERARFWGYQPNVAAIYPQLDYLMTGLPEKEALGLNAIEAQVCGTPVLAPDAPPFTETVAHGASGFRYRDPREDGGRDFAALLEALVAGRPRPDPRIAAREHLARFSAAALLERARRMIAALSDLE